MNLTRWRIKQLVLLCATFGFTGCGFIRLEALESCPPPPEGFSQEDLVGTWQRQTVTGIKDTLVIQEDGKFKQIVEDSVIGMEYESDWHEWRLESSHIGIPYLHLEGMSLCGWSPEEVACEMPGGGEFWWYDDCKEESFQMPEGEVVLIVHGILEQFEQPPRGIKLSLPGGHDRSWAYKLIEP